ncbi:hypothetical protein AB6F62_16580 [Providencia huaxiensis]|uniref:hypothetical protein n=1 Tax=Providencia huaxiensis TaxID=2027290 RepID=UPI0034DD79AA
MMLHQQWQHDRWRITCARLALKLSSLSILDGDEWRGNDLNVRRQFQVKKCVTGRECPRWATALYRHEDAIKGGFNGVYR